MNFSHLCKEQCCSLSCGNRKQVKSHLQGNVDRLSFAVQHEDDILHGSWVPLPLIKFFKFLSLTRVEEEVVLEVGLLAEPAVADVALEGPRARVHVRVRLEVARRRERLGAHRALVRLLLKIIRMKLCQLSKLF